MDKSYFRETLHSGYQQSFDVQKILFEVNTNFQHLVIFENPIFGKVLALDGAIQTTEKDEFIYHEMMTHVPLIAHGDAKRVLVIGGGDGGIVREVLRHKSVEKVVLVEIDQKVIEISKEYFPSHSCGAFDDARLEVVISDGNEYVSRGDIGFFDVILSDSTDPVGPGESLFSSKFYESCSKILGEKGIFVAQNGVPFLQSDELRTSKLRLGSYFDNVSFYSVAVPTYVGGLMTLAFSSVTDYFSVDLQVIQERTKHLINTKYYTPEIHVGAFALPKYVLDLINEK